MITAAESVEAATKRVVADQFGLDTVELSADIASDLGGDSLDMVEIVMTLEDYLHLELTDDDLEKCKTVSDLANLAKRKSGF